jgi:hypothetical protein
MISAIFDPVHVRQTKPDDAQPGSLPAQSFYMRFLIDPKQLEPQTD